MSSVLSSPEACQQFINNADKEPVVMLNLLKFKSDGGLGSLREVCPRRG